MSDRKYLLIVVVAIGAVAAPELPEIAQDYLGNAQCRMCHNKKAAGAQWDVWSKTKHAKALETLKSAPALILAEEKGISVAPSQAPECVKCHVTGYDAAKKGYPAKIKAVDGVQCESCHGPGSTHVADAKKWMISKDRTTIDMTANIKRPDAVSCAGCHNEESPTWDTERYTLEDGTKVGFDFAQAYTKIDHRNPTKQK